MEGTVNCSFMGNSGAFIVFSSYGTGLAPKILGSTEVTAWTNDSGNVWYSNNIVSDPYALKWDANIYFKETDGGISWGRVKKATKGDLTIEYDWVWISNHIYIYSPTNPNTRYSGIEVSQREDCIALNDKEFITIDGFEIAYGASAGVDEAYPQTTISGLIVKNCEIHHIGIKGSESGAAIHLYHSNALIQNNIIHDTGRRGVSISVGDITVSDIIVENNTFYHGFHVTGPSIHNIGSGTLDNVVIRKNLIYDDIDEVLDEVESLKSIGIFAYNSNTGSITNLYIYNNIIKNTTYKAIQLDDVSSSYIYNNTIYKVNPNLTEGYIGMIYFNNGTQITSVIKNNIIYNNAVAVIIPSYSCIRIEDGVSGTITSDYNLFYCSDASASLIRRGGNNYTVAQWATYKSACGQDAHSPTPANPVFVSPTDYHLQPSSTAINAGIWVGLTTDYDGNTANDPPSIGAYEYESKPKSPVMPVYQSSVVENATPSLLEMTYNVSLANIEPAVTAFTVQVNGVTINETSVAILGNKVKLTLSSAIAFGNKVTISYNKSGSNLLQTSSGEEAASINSQPVINNCFELATLVLVSKKERKIIIYPNPAKDNVNILIEDPTLDVQIIKIIDLSGKIVFTDTIEQGIKYVQIPLILKTGNYIVTLETGSLKMYAQKLIVYR